MGDDELIILGKKIEEQQKLLEHWRQPVEPLLFETLRTIDNLFFQDLFYPEGSPQRIPLPHAPRAIRQRLSPRLMMTVSIATWPEAATGPKVYAPTDTGTAGCATVPSTCVLVTVTVPAGP